MNKKIILTLQISLTLLIAISAFCDYKSTYYESISQSSSDYITFVISFYQASHLFCDTSYNCAYSNLTFPELQEQELQKFQDQIDWTSEKALKYNQFSKLFIILAIILNVCLVALVYNSR